MASKFAWIYARRGVLSAITVVLALVGAKCGNGNFTGFWDGPK